jgi:hypothetical protein
MVGDEHGVGGGLPSEESRSLAVKQSPARRADRCLESLSQDGVPEHVRPSVLVKQVEAHPTLERPQQLDRLGAEDSGEEIEVDTRTEHCGAADGLGVRTRLRAPSHNR